MAKKSDNGSRGIFSGTLAYSFTKSCLDTIGSSPRVQAQRLAQIFVTRSSMHNINHCGPLGGRWESLSNSVLVIIRVISKKYMHTQIRDIAWQLATPPRLTSGCIVKVRPQGAQSKKTKNNQWQLQLRQRV